MKTLLLASALGLAVAAHAQAQDTVSVQNGNHILAFQQADIRAFIDDVATVTGYTFLVDPRVQGQVTISSSDELSQGEVFTVFKQVLRNQGYTLLRTEPGVYRVTLIQGAAQDAPFVQGLGAAGTMATTVIRVGDLDASEAAKLIKPVLNPQGVLTANPRGDILVISDFPENIGKARAIVEAMAAATSSFEAVALTNLSSIDAEEALRGLVGQDAQTAIVAVPATNSVLLEGDPGEVARLRDVLRSLDATTAPPRGAISVVPIRYGDGETIAATIASLLPALALEGAAVPTVAYEPGSNTLIINAPGDLQGELESIVRRLDQRRPQVVVEAMIVEISDTLARDLGVQFAGPVDGNDLPFFGTNFSRSPGNLLALTGALAGPEFGLDPTIAANLQSQAVNSLFSAEGGVAAALRIGGGSSLFSVIVNAVEQDDDSNILSTPFITTLDNVPANFLVGQEIPIVTGESFGAGGQLQNPFRTFEREEVGLKLEVLPQITEGDNIRLEIRNEVSSIAGVTATGSGEFILNTRELGTTVLAESGEIVVLGGLIQDDEDIQIDKIPVLGDLPIVGNAFRSKSRQRDRTNLVVFLRPTIVRTTDDFRPITRRRLDDIRAVDRERWGRDVSKFDQLVINPEVSRRLIEEGRTLPPGGFTVPGGGAQPNTALANPALRSVPPGARVPGGYVPPQIGVQGGAPSGVQGGFAPPPGSVSSTVPRAPYSGPNPGFTPRPMPYTRPAQPPAPGSTVGPATPAISIPETDPDPGG